MKALIASFGLFALAISSLHAQQKLWTWKIDDPSRIRGINSISMGEDGSSVFVLSESKGFGPLASYLLVWVNQKGRILLAKRFQPIASDSLNPDEFPKWGVTITSPGRMIAIYGESAHLCLSDGKKAKVIKSIPANGVRVFAPSSFGGWIDHSGKEWINPPNGQYPGFTITSADSITAWRF